MGGGIWEPLGVLSVCSLKVIHTSLSSASESTYCWTLRLLISPFFYAGLSSYYQHKHTLLSSRCGSALERLAIVFFFPHAFTSATFAHCRRPWREHDPKKNWARLRSPYCDIKAVHCHMPSPRAWNNAVQAFSDRKMPISLCWAFTLLRAMCLIWLYKCDLVSRYPWDSRGLFSDLCCVVYCNNICRLRLSLGCWICCGTGYSRGKGVDRVRLENCQGFLLHHQAQQKHLDVHGDFGFFLLRPFSAHLFERASSIFLENTV